MSEEKVTKHPDDFYNIVKCGDTYDRVLYARIINALLSFTTEDMQDVCNYVERKFYQGDKNGN